MKTKTRKLHPRIRMSQQRQKKHKGFEGKEKRSLGQ
jgi:hypothetical protein